MPFAPRTWTSNELVTAALLNTELRDFLNLTAPGVVTTKGDLVAASGANAIGRLAAAAGRHLISDSGEPLGMRWSEILSANVNTSEATSSTSYTDLATAGPSITIDVGSSGIALIHWEFSLGGASGAGEARCGVGINGADPTPDIRAYHVNSVTETFNFWRLFDSLTPGNNIFKLRYRTDGTSINFASRRIMGWSL
jgi:hypothetical protein